MRPPSDFNDLHSLAGIEAVREQLRAGLERAARNPEEYAQNAPACSRDETHPESSEPPEPPWTLRLIRTSQGKVVPNIFNTTLILENDSRWEGVIGYCLHSYRVIKRRAPVFQGGEEGEWQDVDTDRLRIWLAENYGYTPRNADADGAINVAAQGSPFHPVRDYLDPLTWDGTPRLDTWLARFLGAEESEYTAIVGRRWMIAAVARVYRPGCKADNVLILDGDQGLGKSTALSILGGQWFSDTHFALGEKDGYQQMQGVWICELAELDSFSKADHTRAKMFFASTHDRYRPSYGRRTQEYARQCVFAGTTNADVYLRDPTGNRRYWPVHVTRLDAQALFAYRDQLWAEAVHCFRRGEPWHVLDDEKHLFIVQQEGRFEVDVWEEIIEQWLITGTTRRVLMSEVMREALKMDPAHMKRPDQMRVGAIMTRLGWRKVRARTDGGRETGYEAPAGWKAPPSHHNVPADDGW